MHALVGAHPSLVPHDAGAPSPSLTVTSLSALLALSPDRLDSLDIALVNLLCAEGLPGAELLDVRACLGTLAKWTDAVRLHPRQRSLL